MVDTVSKRSKMSYMETHASLEVPAVAPPQHMWPGGTGAIHSSLAALADTPLQHFQPAPFVVGATSSCIESMQLLGAVPFRVLSTLRLCVLSCRSSS